ncbi:MAG: hypothetical protein IIW52_00975 [Alistipes sp.]|nr:hypothetical protein [Alistipes sp.]
MSTFEQENNNELENSTQPEMSEVVIKMPLRLKRGLQSTGNFISSLFTGEIIINQSISKGYDYLFYMALLFLISIVTLFSSLHYQITENQLNKEVALLKERAIRIEEQRTKATTHSAIVKLLKERKIELYDTIEPVTIVEKQSNEKKNKK